MKDKKLREKLGVIQSALYTDLTTGQTGYLPQIFIRLTRLEDMVVRLLEELGYEYQTQCYEGLPKLKKRPIRTKQ
jgi:hypothetical protein